MADSDIQILSTGAPSAPFFPYSTDLSGGKRMAVLGLAKTDGTKVNPATSDLQVTANTALTQIDTDLNAGLGTDGSSPPALPGGATGVRGWLRLLVSKFPASLGATTAALSFPVALSTDGVVATAYGTAADPATPDPSATGASATFTSLLKGIAANGTSLIAAFASGIRTFRPPVTYTAASTFPKALTANTWTKAVTTTPATRALRVAPAANATVFDLEWTVVAANAAAPTDTFGEPIMGGEDFASGIPLGDLYLRSASGQVAIVKTGA